MAYGMIILSSKEVQGGKVGFLLVDQQRIKDAFAVTWCV